MDSGLVHTEHWCHCRDCGRMSRSLTDEPYDAYAERMEAHGWRREYDRWVCKRCVRRATGVADG